MVPNSLKIGETWWKHGENLWKFSPKKDQSCKPWIGPHFRIFLSQKHLNKLCELRTEFENPLRDPNSVEVQAGLVESVAEPRSWILAFCRSRSCRFLARSSRLGTWHGFSAMPCAFWWSLFTHHFNRYQQHETPQSQVIFLLEVVVKVLALGAFCNYALRPHQKDNGRTDTERHWNDVIIKDAGRRPKSVPAKLWERPGLKIDPNRSQQMFEWNNDDSGLSWAWSLIILIDAWWSGLSWGWYHRYCIIGSSWFFQLIFPADFSSWFFQLIFLADFSPNLAPELFPQSRRSWTSSLSLCRHPTSLHHDHRIMTWGS